MKRAHILCALPSSELLVALWKGAPPRWLKTVTGPNVRTRERTTPDLIKETLTGGANIVELPSPTKVSSAQAMLRVFPAQLHALLNEESSF